MGGNLKSLHRRNESSTFRSRKATVRACSMRRGPFCRKTKTHPDGISRICIQQWLLGKKIVAIVAYAPFTLTPGSTNLFQCCQVSKRRLALFTNLVLLCLTTYICSLM